MDHYFFDKPPYPPPRWLMKNFSSRQQMMFDTGGWFVRTQKDVQRRIFYQHTEDVRRSSRFTSDFTEK